jgi:hypothetical protein
MSLGKEWFTTVGLARPTLVWILDKQEAIPGVQTVGQVICGIAVSWESLCWCKQELQSSYSMSEELQKSHCQARATISKRYHCLVGFAQCSHTHPRPPAHTCNVLPALATDKAEHCAHFKENKGMQLFIPTHWSVHLELTSRKFPNGCTTHMCLAGGALSLLRA